MESCICGAFTNLNQYMWNLVNRTYFHTSSILCLRWKDKYQTAKGGLQANVNGMISIQRAIFKITKWSLGTKRRAHAKHVWPAWVWLSSTIQVQLIKYPINRKDWIQLVSKWFDDKTAPKTDNWDICQIPDNCKICKVQDQILNVQYHFGHISILIYHTDLMDVWGWLLQSSCVCQLALRALLTGLALAGWPDREGRRREGLGSCSPSNIRDVNRHTKEFTVYPVYPSHKRPQLSEILSNSLSSLYAWKPYPRVAWTCNQAALKQRYLSLPWFRLKHMSEIRII